MCLLRIGNYLFLLIFFSLTLSGGALASSELMQNARDLFSQSDRAKVTAALEFFKQRKNTDSVGVLVLAMRVSRRTEEIGAVLEEITGEFHGGDWNKWMLWQERNSQVPPLQRVRTDPCRCA